MAETPEWLRDKIKAYYQETTGPYYLQWAGETLAFHVGLEEEAPAPGAPPPTNLQRQESLLRLNRYLADKAQIGPGTRVLDAGCGVGGSSIWLARERGAVCTGVTLDPGQVEMARKFASERGVSNVAFQTADFSATPFAHGSFDVVWNVESLCHSNDARNFLRHVFDLLADGGRWACMDFFRGDRGNPADCEKMCEGWVLPDLQSLESIGRMLADIGFTDIVIEDVTPRVLPSADMLKSGGLWWSVLYKLDEAAGKARGPMGGKHFLAAVGAGDGLKTGGVTYGYVGATRPRRG
ncbi:MAG: methyltransferase domain-containing protein [Polyangiaceae bacterium]